MRFVLALLVLPALADTSRESNFRRTTRVLYVEYPPRYEYKFLASLLKRDPKVLFHAVLTSADDDYPNEHSQKIPSHVPLADRNAFGSPLFRFPQTLSTYEVIILGEVPPNALGEASFRSIRKRVEDEGGGLILICGSSENPESYRGTCLEDLLPVEPLKNPSREVFDKPLKYELTEAGARSGLVRFRAKNPFDQLPPIQWVKRVGRVKPQAKTLVEVTYGSERLPLFCSMNFGRGKVFILLTDETWRWRYLNGDEPYFAPFWTRLLEYVH